MPLCYDFLQNRDKLPCNSTEQNYQHVHLSIIWYPADKHIDVHDHIFWRSHFLQFIFCYKIWTNLSLYWFNSRFPSCKWNSFFQWAGGSLSQWQLGYSMRWWYRSICCWYRLSTTGISVGFPHNTWRFTLDTTHILSINFFVGLFSCNYSFLTLPSTPSILQRSQLLPLLCLQWSGNWWNLAGWLLVS